MTDDLDKLAAGLRLQFGGHINMGRSGHLTSKWIVDATGKKIGSVSVLTKGENVVKKGWSLGDDDFDSFEAFMLAYRQTVRDKEWEAAAPANGNAR